MLSYYCEKSSSRMNDPSEYLMESSGSFKMCSLWQHNVSRFSSTDLKKNNLADRKQFQYRGAANLEKVFNIPKDLMKFDLLVFYMNNYTLKKQLSAVSNVVQIVRKIPFLRGTLNRRYTLSLIWVQNLLIRVMK